MTGTGEGGYAYYKLSRVAELASVKVETVRGWIRDGVVLPGGKVVKLPADPQPGRRDLLVRADRYNDFMFMHVEERARLRAQTSRLGSGG